MKRKLVLSLVTCLGLLIIAYLVVVLRELNTRVWGISADRNMKQLALALELFRAEHDRYPDTLQRLMLATNADIKKYLDNSEVFRNQYHNKYEYCQTTNGFRLIVYTSPSLLRKGSKIEKAYREGEVYQMKALPK